MKTVFILLLLYWGADGRSSMTSAEFNSSETCEAAKVAVKPVMDGWNGKTYAVCTEK